jgi:serine/threonine-protein kinase RsbW
MSLYESHSQEQSLSIVFSSDIDLVSKAVKDAVDFVLKHATGVDQFTFKLALYESLTNAVKHGCRSNPTLKVRLSIELRDRALNITVSDEGEGFDWKKAVDAGEEASDDLEKTSGRGLFLLKSYNCHPAYNEKGNTLFMRIDLVE